MSASWRSGGRWRCAAAPRRRCCAASGIEGRERADGADTRMPMGCASWRNPSMNFLTFSCTIVWMVMSCTHASACGAWAARRGRVGTPSPGSALLRRAARWDSLDTQDAVVPVDVGDGAAARRGVHERGVVDQKPVVVARGAHLLEGCRADGALVDRDLVRRARAVVGDGEGIRHGGVSLPRRRGSFESAPGQG